MDLEPLWCLELDVKFVEPRLRLLRAEGNEVLATHLLFDVGERSLEFLAVRGQEKTSSRGLGQTAHHAIPGARFVSRTQGKGIDLCLAALSDRNYIIQRMMTLGILPIADKDGTGVMLRFDPNAAAIVDSLRAAIKEISGEHVMSKTQTMDSIISDSLASQRFSMAVLGVFAMLALAPPSVGIYGVISYLVGQRTQEIGIRIALGANRSDVLRMVLGDGMKIALMAWDRSCRSIGCHAAYGKPSFWVKRDGSAYIYRSGHAALSGCACGLLHPRKTRHE